MLQFITDYDSRTPVKDQILQAIDGGCRWIEIRMEGASDEEIAKVVEEVKPRCIETESFLLLADNPDLAKTTDVGGVHLRKGDMPPTQARAMLGAAAVIGLDVDNYQEVAAVRYLDIDFLSLPFQKLGYEGIKDIAARMHQDDICMAIVAEGVENPDDVIPLLDAGVNGIAVSKAIGGASDVKSATRVFIDRLPENE